MTNGTATSIERMQALQVDITMLECDAIVNAANNTLLGGGGIDGAIHRAAGPELLQECRGIRGCATDEARLTAGYRLSARFVPHIVGPAWQGGDQGEPALLAQCYDACLQLASTHGMRSLAFLAISCGVYGYPLARATAIAVARVSTHLEEFDTLQSVVFACFDRHPGYLRARARVTPRSLRRRCRLALAPET